MNTCKQLRQLLDSRRLLFVPICPDPLAARIAEIRGFKAVGLGGYALGAKLCVPEPLLTMPEVVQASKYIVDAVNIPLLVDGDAGFGEPIQVMRTVREFINAKTAGISLEDQVYPKRAHYHRDYKEHTIKLIEMVHKIRAADKVRSDLNPDFVIIARTDSLKTEGYDETLERIEAYEKAGADLVMLFPNDIQEAKKLPKDTKIPLVYVNSVGNRVGRPILTYKEAETFGYRMLRDAISTTLFSFQMYSRLFENLMHEGSLLKKTNNMIRMRKDLEGILNLHELYYIEEETTEKVKNPKKTKGPVNKSSWH